MSKILDGLPEEKAMTDYDEGVLALKIQALQRNGMCSEADKNTLVLANMREGVRYGMGVSKNQLPEGEIMSVVYTALLKAAKNYRPGEGLRFFAYAKPYVRGEISTLWRSKDVVKNSSLHETGERSEVIIDENVDELPGEELVPTKSVHHPEGVVDPDFDGIDLREKWAVVEPMMKKCLNEREQMVIQLFYIGGMTFDAISKHLVPQISRPAIQHTHARALRKLKSALRKNLRTV